jgi:hypothetical protein
MTNNSRTSERFQFENSEQIDFSLIDKTTQLNTSYCICSDFSKVGALIVSDIEFPVGQALTLKAQVDGKVIEEIPVKVSRQVSDLCDEERFCVAVEFLQPARLYNRLQRQSGSIAA